MVKGTSPWLSLRKAYLGQLRSDPQGSLSANEVGLGKGKSYTSLFFKIFFLYKTLGLLGLG